MRIRNLKTNTEYNGTTGVVLGFVRETNRIRVQVTTPRRVVAHLRAQNLMAIVDTTDLHNSVQGVPKAKLVMSESSVFTVANIFVPFESDEEHAFRMTASALWLNRDINELDEFQKTITRMYIESTDYNKIKDEQYKQMLWSNVTKAADTYQLSTGPARTAMMEYMSRQAQWFHAMVQLELKRQG